MQFSSGFSSLASQLSNGEDIVLGRASSYLEYELGDLEVTRYSEHKPEEICQYSPSLVGFTDALESNFHPYTEDLVELDPFNLFNRNYRK